LYIDVFAFLCNNLYKKNTPKIGRGINGVCRKGQPRSKGIPANSPCFLAVFFLFGENFMDETMDIYRASEFLKLSRWSIYQMTRKNNIPCHRPAGRKLVFFKSELEKFLRGKKSK